MRRACRLAPLAIAFAALAASAYVLTAEEQARTRPGDALVVVAASTGLGFGIGNGFVIGDGTLAVTARHIVFSTSGRGEHRMAGNVSVLSPYLGEACDAEVLADDEELDLAVLKIPWKGHPRLPLADYQSILSAERLVVTSLRALLPGRRQPATDAPDELVAVESEDLPVDFVAVRNGTPRFMFLAETGGLGPGWSGAPVLLPGGEAVAGCFTRIMRGRLLSPRKERLIACAGAVAQVKALLQALGTGESVGRGDFVLARPDDAREAFAHCFLTMQGVTREDPSRELKEAQAFIGLRPESAYAYRAAASAAARAGRQDLADSFYEKALELDAEGEVTRLGYAQYLTARGDHAAAEAVLEDLWRSGARREWVALSMFNVLSARGEQHQRALELLSQALEENPRNALLWFNSGACHYRLGDHDAAVSAYARAVELIPEARPFRATLARALEKAGDIDEAEKHFRILLNIERENSVVHFWLARFLATHRPAAVEEATQEAETALRLYDKEDSYKQRIRDLIRQLRLRTERKENSSS